MPTVRRSWPLMCLFAAACDPPPTVPREDGEEVCYDTFDNDADGDADCLDAGCDLTTCCVGAGTEACCAAPAEIFSVSLAGCADGDPGGCVPDLDLYGAPVVVDGALSAGPGVDNGALLLTPLDVAGSAFRITFEAATATSCTGDCLNFLAVGLASSAEAPRFTGFALAVILRPNRNDAALFAHGEQIATWSVDPGFHRYALDLRPDGTAAVSEVDADGETVRELVPEFVRGVDEPAWLGVVGRAEGIPKGELPARVRAIEVSRGTCDMPQRAGPLPDPVIPAPGSPDAAALADVEGVGRARNAAGVEVVAVDVGDAFHLFRADAAGAYVRTAPLEEPAVVPASAVGLEATGIDDPWLVADEDAGRWQLYFTVRTGPNASVVGRLSSGPGFADTFDDATFVVAAESTDSGFPKLEQPTVAGDRMIARAANVDAGILVRLEREGPDRWVAAGEALADGKIHQPRFDDLFAMDSQEVADPALVEVDGMLRLLFAGRRGSSWRIGLLVSFAGEDWLQPLGEDPLWELDDGFAAFGARDPVAWVEDGRLRLLFVGVDGSLSAVVGAATSGTTTGWPVP